MNPPITTTAELVYALKIVQTHLSAAYFTMEREHERIPYEKWCDFVNQGRSMYISVTEMLEAAQARTDDKAFQGFLSTLAKPPKRARKRKATDSPTRL